MKIQTKFFRPSVYFLVGHNEEVLYVGSSTQVMSRIGSHLGPKSKLRLRGFRDEELAYILFWDYDTIADARKAERNAISATEPKYNIDGKVPRYHFPIAYVDEFGNLWREEENLADPGTFDWYDSAYFHQRIMNAHSPDRT